MAATGIALIVESLKDDALLVPFQHFKTKKYVKDSADGPSIIFPECQPSLAAVVVDFSSAQPPPQMGSILKQMVAVQSRFKNVYALLVQIDTDRWDYLQRYLQGGQLRMLRVGSAAEGGRLLMSIYLALKDTPKLKLQRDYFAKQEANVVSIEAAQHIARSTFSNLGVPEVDGTLILDGFATLKSIITASREELYASSPADQHSIDKIASFFGAKHA